MESNRKGSPRVLVRLSVLGVLLAGQPSWASNAEFQSFFFTVCASPSALLAARCAETDGAQGDLSGDSESSLNPSQTLSSGDAALLAAQQRSQQIRDRMAALHDAEPHAGQAADGARVDLGPFSLLVNARTAVTESERLVDQDAERGYQLDESGAELGLDYRAGDRLVWGAWLQWGNSDLEFDRENPGNNFAPLADAGAIETDRLGITTYVSARIGDNGYLDGSIGYTDLAIDASRNAVFQESNRVVPQTNAVTAADTDGRELMATVSARLSTQLGAWNVAPFVGVTHVDTRLDDYVEADLSASGLALGVALDDQSLTVGQVGVGISRAISMDGWVLVPQLRVEYLTELSSDRSGARVRFVNDAGNNVLRLAGDDVDDDRIDIAVGVAGVLRNGWIPFVEYQLTTGADHFERYQISAGLRVEL